VVSIGAIILVGFAPSGAITRCCVGAAALCGTDEGEEQEDQEAHGKFQNEELYRPIASSPVCKARIANGRSLSATPAFYCLKQWIS
jgi:hypothetical protein